MILAAAGPSPLWYLSRGTGADHARPAVDDACSSGSAGRCAGVPACGRRASWSTACTATSRCSWWCCSRRTSSPRCSIPSRTCASLDAFVPLASHYRPFGSGFGALAFDLLLALIVTSLLRARLGPARLAGGALGRLPVLARRGAPRAGHRHRRALGLAAGADRSRASPPSSSRSAAGSRSTGPARAGMRMGGARASSLSPWRAPCLRRAGPAEPRAGRPAPARRSPCWPRRARPSRDAGVAVAPTTLAAPVRGLR